MVSVIEIPMRYGWTQVSDLKMRHEGTGQVKDIPGEWISDAFSDPDVIAEAALRGLEIEWTERMDAAPGVGDTIGVRLILADESGEYRSMLLPYMYTDESQADRLATLVVHSPHASQMVAWWHAQGHVTLPVGKWIPIAAKMVKLAEVPF